jgi:hypothetical protein
MNYLQLYERHAAEMVGRTLPRVPLAALGGPLPARRAPRLVGVLVAVPFVWLALEVTWVGPSRPARGVVLAPKSALVAEPRKGLPAVAELRAGVTVEVLGRGPEWTRVRVGERSGYVPAPELGIVE